MGAGYICDFGDSDAILALFDRIEAAHGPVSALINNAGMALPANFLDYELEAFDKVLGVNLRGVFVATQRAAKAMIAREIEGAIVNMSSINAKVAIPALLHIARVKRGCKPIDESGLSRACAV